ncbi:MAG: hypothetical protein NTV38_12860 [Chloroflexi bacterium]|nr:hypothetical protein [Chloroflexota bacterium]
MKVIVIELMGNICWHVINKEILSAPIEALWGLRIVSPLAKVKGIARMSGSSQLPLPDRAYLVFSNILLLASLDKSQRIPDMEEINGGLQCFLNALRVVSRQAGLSRRIMVLHSPREHVLHDIAPACSRFDERNIIHIHRYILESAVTQKSLLNASSAAIGGSIPVHDELINDSAEELMQSNYRASIVFAAMAVESCAGIILDREYERITKKAKSSSKHRCVTIKVNKKESIRKDPVYVALRAGAGEGGSRFLNLLHACPLYLLGKSLQLNKPKLYQQAHSLYRTRNDLAHTGTTTEGKDGLLPVTREGAFIAIETANAVLKWFGERGTCIPTDDFVQIGLDR